MKFTAKTDEELKVMGILPKGEYDFDVLRATDAISKKGNEMIEITLAVYPLEGEKTTVFDYLLEAMPHKLKHFCDTVGLKNEYAEGHITADMCTGRSGRCKIDIEPKSEKYEAKNIVKDYISTSVVSSEKNLNMGAAWDAPF